MLPYFVFCLISLPYYWLLNTGLSPKDIFLRIIMFRSQTIWNAPLYYLFALYFIEIIFAAIKVYSKKSITLIYLAVFFTLSYLFCFLTNLYYFSIEKIMLGLFFYTLGYLIKSYDLLEKIFSKRFITLIVSLLLSIFFGVVINRPRTLFSDYQLNNYFYYCISVISGSLFIILICKAFFDRSLKIDYMAKNSLFVMSTHFALISIYRMVCENWNINSIKNAIIGLVITFLVVLFYYPLIKFLQTVWPFLLFNGTRSSRKGVDIVR